MSVIAKSNGEVIRAPEGASGPIPTESGKGFQLTGGSGGAQLHPAWLVSGHGPVTSGGSPIRMATCRTSTKSGLSWVGFPGRCCGTGTRSPLPVFPPLERPGQEVKIGAVIDVSDERGAESTAQIDLALPPHARQEQASTRGGGRRLGAPAASP